MDHGSPGRRLLSGTPPRWSTDPTNTRPFLLELTLDILTPSTSVTDEQLLDG